MEYLKQYPQLSTTIGITIPILYLIRKWSNGGKCKINGRIDDQVIIVTGGNNGIGKETAKILSLQGATVVIACRSEQRATEAIQSIQTETKNKDLKIFYMNLDLANLQSIRDFCENFKKTYNRLDVLINNAGLGSSRPKQTEDGFELVFGVNHIGTFAVTLQLMDILAATPNSRIVTVSSVGHTAIKETPKFQDAIAFETPYKGFKNYVNSKLANILFTKELQRRIDAKQLKIKAVSLHPGAVRTDIFNDIQLPLKIAFTLLYPIVLLTFKNTFYGAQTSLQCALENFESLVPGAYYVDCKIKESSKIANDMQLAAKLFNLSEEWTKLKF